MDEQEPPSNWWVAAPEVCVSLAFEGRILKQTPLPLPESDPDAIVIRWPWRIDLSVRRVLFGQFDGRRIEAQGIQHAEIRRDYGRTFLLGAAGNGHRVITISPQRLSTREELREAAKEVGADLCEGA